MEKVNKQNSLFIICPFCQLETFLRTKYGSDLFFITTTAGVLNLDSNDISAMKDIIQREHINNIYLVNDIGCNFIEEAINNEKEFGLPSEQQLRRLVQNNRSIIKSEFSAKEKKIILAETNVQQQAKYLASEKILKYEVTTLEINIHTLVVNKHESLNHKFELN